MFYRAVFTDTVNKLKNFNLSILRRVLAAKVSKHSIKGLKGKEKENYYKIPERNAGAHSITVTSKP